MNRLTVIILIIAAVLVIFPQVVREAWKIVPSPSPSPSPIPRPEPDASLQLAARALQMSIKGRSAESLRDLYEGMGDVLESLPDGRVATNGGFREIHRTASAIYAKQNPELSSLGVERQISDVFAASINPGQSAGNYDDKVFDRLAAVRACRAIAWACQ